MPFSTHDWTQNVLDNPFKEAWADVKTPGGHQGFEGQRDTRRTYVVGTIEVQRTGPTAGNPAPAYFSNHVATSSVLPTFDVSTPAIPPRYRQVAMLQVNDAQDGIVWQRYFYGLTGLAEDPVLDRPTNARAVSVWAAERVGENEADDDPNTRIAICGETWDERLLLSQAPSGWPPAAFATAGPTGFIAVYNGNGVLLWTHHFFAGTDGTRSCAITDLAIRVDGNGDEIVTYCGIMTHGDPGLGSELSPLRPFAMLPGLAGGATVRAPGWDGFVGRLRRSNGVTTREFHSIVSGNGQDGLFGLAEITPDRFVVVGSANEPSANPTAGSYPIWIGTPVAPYTLGVALVFDAQLVAGGGNLVADSAAALGGDAATLPSRERATVARDVCVGWDVGFHDSSAGTVVSHVIYVAGSTDDPNFSAGQFTFTKAPPAAQATLQGPTDGFLAVLREFPTSGALPPVGVGFMVPHTYSYWGSSADDGLTGVNCWNEFGEHVGVTGWQATGTSGDIGVSTYFLNNAFGPSSTNSSPPNDTQQLLLVRDTLIGGTSDDRPTRMGFRNATDAPQYSDYGLDRPEGGGVAVRNDGRMHSVGSTNPTGGGYPVVNGRNPDMGIDAVRTVLDMVPPGSGAAVGVGRTDGTGFQGAGFIYPPAGGLSGGTTPLCGLRPFGRRVGETPPILTHMLIDYEGVPPATNGNDSAILVTRPPSVGVLTGGVLSVTLTSPSAQIWPTGVEVWLDPLTPYTLLLAFWEPNRAFRMRLPQLLGSWTMTVQYLQLLDPSLTPVSLGTGCSSVYAASQAMFFSW